MVSEVEFEPVPIYVSTGKRNAVRSKDFLNIICLN